MSEELWNAIQQSLMQQSPAHRLCVGCWYKTSPIPFPSEASSSLCEPCAQEVRSAFSVSGLCQDDYSSYK